MRVALPVWERRISPVFDESERISIADVKRGKITSQFIIPFQEKFPPGRAIFLTRWGVEILICGGISAYLAQLVAAQGIRVIPGIRGGVEDVLQAFCLGNIPSARFLMPGWRGWRRRGYRSRR